MRIPKVKTQEELDIEEEIRKEGERVRNSDEHKFFQAEIAKLWLESSNKEDEGRKLKKMIAGKYVNVSYNYNYRGFLYKEIKSAVKVGIKKGLGIKHINLIREDDMVRIVKQLIEKDLAKTNEKDIRADIDNIQKKINKLTGDKDKLFVKYKELQDKQIAIENKANKTYKVDLNKEVQRKASRKIIEEKLPEYMTKITEEVTKELIVDTLNKSNEMQNGTTK